MIGFSCNISLRKRFVGQIMRIFAQNVKCCFGSIDAVSALGENEPLKVVLPVLRKMACC